MSKVQYEELAELKNSVLHAITGLIYVSDAKLDKSNLLEVCLWCGSKESLPIRIRGAGDGATLQMDNALPMPFIIGDNLGETVLVSLKPNDVDLGKTKITGARMLQAETGMVAIEIEFEDTVISVTMWDDEIYFEGSRSRYLEFLREQNEE